MSDEYERESIYPREFSTIESIEYENELQQRLIWCRKRITEAEYGMEFSLSGFRQSYRYQREEQLEQIEDLVFYAVTGLEPEQRIPF